MSKFDTRLEKVSADLGALSEKAARAAEEAKAAQDLHKEALTDQISTVKGDVAAFKENVRIDQEKERGRIASALLKAQMTVEAKIQERRGARDQRLMEMYVADQLDYIDECFGVAAYLVQNGQLALLETLDAVAEFEAKYGKLDDAQE